MFIAGIDEAGRGPIAGPVAVGIAVVKKGFNWDLLPGVTDSKKISERKRAVIFKQAKAFKKEKKIDFVVVMMSAKQIDKMGVSKAIAAAIEKGCKKLQLDARKTHIKLDGLLKAPVTFKQETIIKGDQKEKIIGLASICAKETRDAYMIKVDKKFPEYGFAIHKGYGTKNHRMMVCEHGMSTEHRDTYCQNRHLWCKVNTSS